MTLKNNSRIPGYLLIAVLTDSMIYFGFKRERNLLVFSSDTVFTFVHKYPRVAPTDYKKEMGGVLGFKLSPKLTSSILFSLIYLVLTSAIVQLIFRNRKYTRITIFLFAVYMVVCFVLIQVGALGVDYHLSVGLSHYLEDLFLSPFPLMLLIPAFMLASKMEMKN